MADAAPDPLLSDGVVDLRPWTAADAAFYLECCSDDEAKRFTSHPPGLSEADVVAAIESLPQRPDRRAYLIADTSTGERLGNLSADGQDGVVELSYMVLASARGRGVATRALRLANEDVVMEADVSVLRLWTHAANTASRRVAERAGFVRDPSGDGVRVVNGERWPTVEYQRTVLDRRRRSAPPRSCDSREGSAP